MASYTPADRARITVALADRLAAGASLEEIAAAPGWPSRPTLRKWAREDPALAAALAEGWSRRRDRDPFPFDPAQADELLRRVRYGEPLSRLLREPGLPRRRALNAWQRADPRFRALLKAAKAVADDHRRRYGPRRSRMPYDEAVADRLLLAAVRGDTLPELHKDPTLPTRAGVRRWRRQDPDFDISLRVALKLGHKARGRLRAGRYCTPELTERIEDEIIHGASLSSLGRRPDMPSLFSLYKWVRTRPDFAAAIAEACDFRNDVLAGDAVRNPALRQRLGQLNPYPGERRRKR